MCRLIFASIVTAVLLPGLLFPPPASGMWMSTPGIGSAAGIQLEAK